MARINDVTVLIMFRSLTSILTGQINIFTVEFRHKFSQLLPKQHDLMVVSSLLIIFNLV